MNTQRRDSDIGFASKNSLASPIAEFPRDISDRTMLYRIKLMKGRFLTFVSIYTPTMSRSAETIGQFYNDLTQLLRKVPISSKLIILRDFDAGFGNDYIL